MSELAKQLIEENLRTQNPKLDLGNCGLDGTEASLEQLKECVHLRELVLSDHPLMLNRPQKWGGQNNLVRIPSTLPASLEKLIVSGRGRARVEGERMRIDSLIPIQHLTELTYLDVSDNDIASLSGIENLTKLTYLDLNSNKFATLKGIESLTELTTLDIGRLRLTSLAGIEVLNKLVKLNVSFNGLRNLEGIDGLEHLVNLNIRVNKLKNLSGLDKCQKLKKIDARDNDLLMEIRLENMPCIETLLLGDRDEFEPPHENCYFTKVKPKEIREKRLYLRSLPKLQDLEISNLDLTDVYLEDIPLISGLDLSDNLLTDLSFLANLSQITFVSLESNLLTNLKGLEALPMLKSLSVSNNYLTTEGIQLLNDFRQLKSLNLGQNQIACFPFSLFNNLARLTQLYLLGNPIANIPTEILDIYEEYEYPGFDEAVLRSMGNCLKNVQTYFSDLAQGKTKVHQSKVILIGNGRTGKTSLVKRWLDNTFDASEASTHAIQLRAHFMPQLEQAKELDHVQVNIWDFGGQDIYHSTHLLFMQTQAVFVLVWDAETEAQVTQEETLEDGSVVTYQNQPLTYWLDYAHNLGNRSPILVVQTKKEQHGEQLPDNWNALKTRYNIVGHVSVDSAQADAYKNGFKSLQLELEKVIYAQIEKSCTDLPSSWWQVRQQIEGLQENQQKTLSQEVFLQICEQAQLSESSKNTLRNYLHDTGFFFYSSVLFDGKIIIDQQWAIEAVYTLLDRQGMFMKYRGKGFFFGEDLSLVWGTRSLAEQELLVSFMESCEMCVEVSHYWGELASGFVPFKKREYLAPQLLPDESIPNQADIFPEGAKGVYMKLAHPFLHAGVMQHLIVLYASKASPRENIKKNCIYLHYGQQKVLVQASLANHEIVVRLANPDSDEAFSDFDEVLEAIRFDLLAIGQHLIGVREMISVDGSGYIIWNALRNHSPQNPKIRADNGQEYDFAEFKVFLSRGRRSVNHPPSQNNDVASSVPSDLKQAVEQALEFLNHADFAQYFEVLRTDLIPEEHLATYNRLKKMLIIEGVKVDYDEQLRVFAKTLL